MENYGAYIALSQSSIAAQQKIVLADGVCAADSRLCGSRVAAKILFS